MIVLVYAVAAVKVLRDVVKENAAIADLAVIVVDVAMDAAMDAAMDEICDEWMGYVILDNFMCNQP